AGRSVSAATVEVLIAIVTIGFAEYGIGQQRSRSFHSDQRVFTRAFSPDERTAQRCLFAIGDRPAISAARRSSGPRTGGGASRDCRYRGGGAGDCSCFGRP